MLKVHEYAYEGEHPRQAYQRSSAGPVFVDRPDPFLICVYERAYLCDTETVAERGLLGSALPVIFAVDRPDLLLSEPAVEVAEADADLVLTEQPQQPGIGHAPIFISEQQPERRGEDQDQDE